MPLTIVSLCYGIGLNRRYVPHVPGKRGFLDDFAPLGPTGGGDVLYHCALVLDVLAAAECLTRFHGVLPDVF